ncbi:MAG TPA: hybrid sensor histidine kinase/response regulator [Cyanobacteria bacterium UBA11049]|nr:hybrid sensor histidine kinase/response regulator [Cyanobacteria bacterium UBA11049]
MAIDSDIRDQAYQFFIQEAPELLQLIEEELLTLKTERSTAKIHNMMRAAHSIKGGAASVGLETIKTLAHSLEDIFKGLHNEELEIDDSVEGLLLEAYDCLRIPLMEQINTGQFDLDQAMAAAEPVFARIEAQIGEYLRAADTLPSSVDLGVDIALSIFEVDVAQGIERLKEVLAQPQGKEIAGELRAQVEVFTGIAEMLNLPGFGAIAQTALAALEAHPGQALQITQLALANFETARLEVMSGDRTKGGTPSEALAELALSAHAPISQANNFTSLEDVFGSIGTIEEIPRFTEQAKENFVAQSDSSILPSLDDIFGAFSSTSAPADINPSSTPNLANVFSDLEQPILNAEVLKSVPTQTNETVADPIQDEVISSIPSLDDVFGSFNLSNDPTISNSSSTVPVNSSLAPNNNQNNSSEIFKSIEQVFSNIPAIEALATPTDSSSAIVPAPAQLPKIQQKAPIAPASTKVSTTSSKPEASPASKASAAQLSVRVDLERLERMNNLIGELAINRNSLALQNEQLQVFIQELMRKFGKFQQIGEMLRDFSDQLVVDPGSYGYRRPPQANSQTNIVSSSPTELTPLSQTNFDSLEMDSYGELHSIVQTTIEEMAQLEETVVDVVLLAGQSSQTLEKQRQMLGHLRDDLMWARMLPLSEILNRFPRMLRDLSMSYQKQVELKLSGTGVLVDKAVLEKLNDPLVHLVRNAFDHGIETPEERRQQGKPEQGIIEIRAYHQGSQTIVEVRDNGRGVNLERIRTKAIEKGLLSAEQAETANPHRLLEVLFEPGFSTASQVSQLSGRGVGLDVVRDQLRSLKGNVTITSEPGQGTVFTLRIPLTLSIAKLLICFVGSNVFAVPSDSIAEILIPQPEQVKLSGGKRFLHWQGQILPAYRLSQLLNYACPLPEAPPNQALTAVPTPDDWASPMLLLEQDDRMIALEIDRLVTEQELVIKPFGAALAPPSYIYGCTIWGDGCLIPVFDAAGLLNAFFGETKSESGVGPMPSLPVADLSEEGSGSIPVLPAAISVPTVLVVDDSITVRQTLVLTLQKADYKVLQARDGREAINQLQKNSNIQLVISDVEMPNMNGFEFLSHRRTDPQISKIPVVMLTSRSSEKHRQLAMHLGAKHYFTKPYIEQEFLAAIKNILSQNASAAQVLSLSH